MKKIYYLLLTLIASVVGFSTAQAYEVDFNTAITGNTTESVNVVSYSTTVTVATGWKHIISEMEYSYYTSRYTAYQYAETAGVDGTGALRVGNQFTMDSYGDYSYANDLLVTPVVKGTVTLQAKRVSSSPSPYVEFYAVSGAGDDLTQGDKLTATVTPEGSLTSLGDINIDEWVTYTLTVPAKTRIGIKAENVYIDNFTATEVDFSPQASLQIMSISPSNPQTIAADADGNFNVTFTATVKNNGEKDLTTDMDGYSVALYKYNDGGTFQEDHTLLATTAITQDLIQGGIASSLELTATMNTADYPEAVSDGIVFRIYENISGTFKASGLVKVAEYKPEIDITTKIISGYSSKTIHYENGEQLYFGKSREAVEQEVTITNVGGAALTITGVTVPAGYATTLAAQTIEAQESATFTITMDAETTGVKDGEFVIASNASEDFKLNLHGVIAPEDTYFVDFESDASVAGMSFEREEGSSVYGWRSKYTNDMGYPANTYSAYSEIRSYSTQTAYKAITPLLEVAQGDVLTIDVARYAYSEAQLKVYYSADRQNWTLVRTLSTLEDTDEADLLVNIPAPKNNRALKEFTIDNIPAGQWYIAFEHSEPNGGSNSNIYLDNIYGFKKVDVARDVVMAASNIATTGIANSKLTASLTLRNLLPETVEAAAYTAKLYFDDEVQKEVAAVDLQGPAFDANGITTNNDAVFDFSFMPHAAGTFQARFEVAFTDGTVLATTPVAVTISEENYAAWKQVGATSATTPNAPVNYYFNKTQAEMIYTAEELAAAGITAGTQINSIAFLGYNTAKEITAPTKVWMAVNTGDEYATYGSATEPVIDVDNATPLFDGEATLKKVGSSTDYQNLLTIELSTPFTYTGGHLAVMTYFNGSTYTSSGLYFAAETFADTKAIARRSDNNFEPNATTAYSAVMTSAYGGSPARPAILLGIDADAPTVSGKVTDAQGAAIEGVSVEAANGEILYSGTTDAEGKYTITIKKDALDYTLTAKKDGYFPKSQDNVSVATGNQTVDLQLEEAKGFFIEESSIPATAMVNFAVTATAKATNYTNADFAAGSYTAKLYLGDEAVAEAEAVELKTGETANYTFTFTPHAEGTFQARIEFVEGENTAATEATDLVIGEELVGGNVQVGTQSGTTTSTYVPYYWTYADANNGDRTDILYSPEMLAEYGITAGSKITAISFTGTVGGYSSKTLDNIDLRAWVGLQDATEFTAGNADKDNMKYVEVYTGESITFTVNDVHTITIDFGNEPLVYDGTSSIRLYQELDAHGKYTTISYPMDSNYTGGCYYSSSATGSFLSVSGTPVAYFSVAAGQTVTGTVTAKADNAPVADATVSFKSGDVLYTGTTDAEGKYEVVIKQDALDYTIEAAADGYATQVVAFGKAADGNLTKDIVLDTPKKVSGTITDARTEAGVENVKVTVANDDNTFEATTAADGTYEVTVDVLGDGIEYTLTIAADGYEPVDEVALGEVAEDKTQDFTLQTLAKIISGTITDGRTNEALAGVTVKINEVETTTDAEGKYELSFDNLSTNTETFTIEASLDGYTTESAEIVPNTDLTQDFVLNTIAKLLYGVITDENSAVVAGATITVKNGETVYTTTSDAEGKYEVLVDPTLVYDVTVTADEFVEKTVSTEAPLTDDTELNIEIESVIHAGISGIHADGKATNGKVYDLNGRLVGNSLKDVKQQGVYIVNGKKVTVK